MSHPQPPRALATTLPARSLLTVLVAGLFGLTVSPARADERADLEQLRATTLALIQALVDQGLITGARAQVLVRQATVKPVAQDAAAAPVAAAVAPAQAASANEWGRPPTTATVRVPYIPETMKAQIKDDIKWEVLATAREEGWADARKLPAWLKTFHFQGDLRVREEGDLFAAGNVAASLYRAQVESPAWSPDLTNTQTNRVRQTLRARFGFTAGVSDDVASGFRLSTGNGATSASQTLGSSPGFFNRYSVGLDRAWLRWEPKQGLNLVAGRMANPYFSTDLAWPDDVSLDGFNAHAEQNLASGSYAFANLGAFALQELELSSQDKRLVGAQVGVDWALGDKTGLRLGAALYDFQNVAGVRETAPAPTGALAGTTAYYATQYPAGARLRGNTLINLNDPTNTGAPVWGLASKFRPVNLTAALTLKHFDPVLASMTLDLLKNTAFDLADIQKRAGSTAVADLANKSSAAQLRFQLGSHSMAERGSWSTSLALRKFERDAWIDALTDTTWNLGGTNYRGYSLGGVYAFDRNATVGLRWTSTRNLDDGRRFLTNPADPTSLTANMSSAPLKIDVIQLDLNASF